MAFRRWKEKEEHKYVARVPLKNPTEDRQFRYFYTKEEYQKYLSNLRTTNNNNKKVENKKIKTKQKKDVKKKTEDKTKDKLLKIFDKINKKQKQKNKLGKILKDGEALVNKFLNKNGKTKLKNDKVSSNPVAKFVLKTIKNGIGSAIVSTAYDYLYKKQEQEKKKETKKEKEIAESFEDLKKKNKNYTKKEDQSVVNPNYDPYVSDYSMNCPWCTAAYDLRRRGYDVEAGPNPNGESALEIVSWYDGAKIVELDDIEKKHPEYGTSNRSKAIEKELLSQGEGARGHFLVYWTSGGGHDVAYEVEKGKVVLRDCQVDETYTVKEIMDYSEYMFYIRTDNVKPNKKVLKTVRNRK